MMKHIWKTLSLLLVMVLATGCALSLPGLAPAATQTSAPPPTPVPLLDVTVVPRASRPNILFILTDDLDAKLGTLQYMPHLQQLLVSQGVMFNDFLIDTPLCCPSRSSFLRGQYVHNHQVYTNGPPLGGFDQFYQLQHEDSTLATWLQQAGYRTALFGKYLNGYPYPDGRGYIPPGWTDWLVPVKGSPYKEFNYTMNDNGRFEDHGQGQNDYMTDVLSQKADDFIRASASDAHPFFLYLSTYAPHEPAVPAPRDANLFSDLTAPRTPSFNEADVSDKPPAMRADPLLNGGQIANIDQLYRNRLRSMQSVDEMLARLINTLQQVGQLDNTYIIFASDNGYHLGQHRLAGGKGTAYEEDIVVPLIVRGPGVQAGAALDGYVSGNIDIAPTIADLAGVVPPSYVDGRSLVPLLRAQRPPPSDWRQGYLIEYYGAGEGESANSSRAAYNNLDPLLEPPDLDQFLPVAATPNYLALRTPGYTYVEYQGGFRELYDLKQDPYELNNIASTADSNLLSQLSAWLKSLAACSGPSCRTADLNGIH
ncbi:MAG TPA: sulfatase [Anaerolineales bacterium]|nr:sulfatase [Anaerolineales bacterium]